MLLKRLRKIGPSPRVVFSKPAKGIGLMGRGFLELPVVNPALADGALMLVAKLLLMHVRV